MEIADSLYDLWQAPAEWSDVQRALEYVTGELSLKLAQHDAILALLQEPMP